jgi:hypothetical protein
LDATVDIKLGVVFSLLFDNKLTSINARSILNEVFSDKDYKYIRANLKAYFGVDKLIEIHDKYPNEGKIISEVFGSFFWWDTEV